MINKDSKEILAKSGIFVGMFILISVIIGQKIVSSALLYKFGIFIYGGMGYILLFSFLAFVLIYRQKLSELKNYSFRKSQTIFAIASLICLAGFCWVESNIQNISPTPISIIAVHVLFLSIFASLILAVFGPEFAKDFTKKFRKEIFKFLAFGIVAYFLMNLVWKLWPVLSGLVLKIVFFFLRQISAKVQIVDANTIVFEGFAVKIAEACSGVYSIFIFASLYLFAVFLDWKRINKLKAGILFLPAVAGAFAVNILRVFILITVGAYLSKELAIGLYHSYVGMIFFLIYFSIFWAVFYRWMKK